MTASEEKKGGEREKGESMKVHRSLWKKGYQKGGGLGGGGMVFT